MRKTYRQHPNKLTPQQRHILDAMINMWIDSTEAGKQLLMLHPELPDQRTWVRDILYQVESKGKISFELEVDENEDPTSFWVLISPEVIRDLIGYRQGKETPDIYCHAAPKTLQ